MVWKSQILINGFLIVHTHRLKSSYKQIQSFLWRSSGCAYWSFWNFLKSWNRFVRQNKVVDHSKGTIEYDRALWSWAQKLTYIKIIPTGYGWRDCLLLLFCCCCFFNFSTFYPIPLIWYKHVNTGNTTVSR